MLRNITVVAEESMKFIPQFSSYYCTYSKRTAKWRVYENAKRQSNRKNIKQCWSGFCTHIFVTESMEQVISRKNFLRNF